MSQKFINKRIQETRVPKIILEGYLDVPDEDLDAVRAELPSHIALTRKESGCLIFNVEEDSVIANRFNVYEEFESPEAYDAHQERMKSSPWRSISRNAQREYKVRRV